MPSSTAADGKQPLLLPVCLYQMQCQPLRVRCQKADEATIGRPVGIKRAMSGTSVQRLRGRRRRTWIEPIQPDRFMVCAANRHQRPAIGRPRREPEAVCCCAELLLVLPVGSYQANLTLRVDVCNTVGWGTLSLHQSAPILTLLEEFDIEPSQAV
ncbi:MAG: hypothetical protein HC876_23550 [Chloroflexaceae bacterium]|nr:hypothetical protein [Chloroflexaceae bacterium]